MDKLECPLLVPPELGATTSIPPSLRSRVFLRYRGLLESLFQVPLWPTYYQAQLLLWLKATHPKFARVDPPPLSAETVVRYLVRTYGESSGRFLFHETQKAGFIRALRAHRPPNYLFSHLATELASLPAPADGKCRPSLFHDVAGLIAKCLRTPAGRRNLETAMVVDCIPRPLRDRFDKQFLADLQDRFGRAQTAFHALGGEISRLEQNFFEASGSSVATYLAAVAPPLAFLDRANELGQVSRVFKSKVKGGVFPVENLSVATLSHFWPELGVALPRLSPAEAGRLRSQACRAIRGEIHRLLEAPPPEAKKAPSGREGAILQGLEKLCRSHDLKHAVLYFTGKEFVCFREDEVFADIARKNTEKYPPDFVAKMKKRRGATLPSPLLNVPPLPALETSPPSPRQAFFLKKEPPLQMV